MLYTAFQEEKEDKNEREDGGAESQNNFRSIEKKQVRFVSSELNQIDPAHLNDITEALKPSLNTSSSYCFPG